MKKLLLQLDSDKFPSAFDCITAYDAGVDNVLSYGEIVLDNVPNIVYGAMFTREVGELKNTAIFTDDKAIYVFNNRLFIKETDSDIQCIFEQLHITDAGHAFYLGKELQKAAQAVRLRKKYVQDEPLCWGYLSRDTLTL